MAAMVPVREYFDRVSADLACSSLKAAGIAAVVMGDDMGGMRPDLGIIGRVRVMVPEPEREEATALLDAMERQRPQLVEDPPDEQDDAEWAQQKSARAAGLSKMMNWLFYGTIALLIFIVLANYLADR